MAGKTLTMDRLKKALETHITATGQTISEGEDLGVKRFLLNPGNITVRVEDGRLMCNSQGVYDSLVDILMFQDEAAEAPETAISPAPKTNVPTPDRYAKSGLITPDQAKEISRITQDKGMAKYHKDKSQLYNTEDGQAPSAAMVNRAANVHRFCTEIKEFTVTDDLVRAHVRVTDPGTGQFKEDGVAFTKNAFVAKKTLDIVNKHIKKNPGLVIDVDPVSQRPILSPDAQIYGVPAPLFVAKEVLKSWNFLGRFAVTTAERRCQDKLLNAEFREREEIELEQAEMADVAEGA